METKKSEINRQMGLALKREFVGSDTSVEKIADAVNIAPATMYRMWSKNPRDINITQITWMAGLLNTTPQALVADAVRRAGGMAEIMREAFESIEASEASDTNVTQLHRKKIQDMSTDEIENISEKAAYRDPSAGEDEQFD